MSTFKPLPATVGGLIDELDTMYPPRCIAVGESLEKAHRYAGARELVDHLKELRAKDERFALKASLITR